MRTIILLAGHATRMRPLSDYINKGMIPVAGKPLAEHVIARLVAQGFDDICLVVSRFPEQLVGYFGDGSAFGCSIEYVEQPEPLGTAGAVDAMREHIPADESFLVHYGDILTNLDVRTMRAQHESTHAAATLGLVTNVPIHAGVAELDKDNKVTYFSEKPPLEKPCHAAVNIFGPRVWDYLAPGLDFGYDVIPAMLEAGEDVRGFLDRDAWWMDVGRLSDLDAANALMQSHGDTDG